MIMKNIFKRVRFLFKRRYQEEKKIFEIENEFRNGIDQVKDLPKSVTFYGSARLKEDHPYFKKVYDLAFRISKELDFAVLSGGGWGVMAASNKGAHDAGGESIGLTIRLPHEQQTNPYVTKEINFNYFFSRQASMSYATEACVFCPGGFGTLNELFELLTLRQTDKIGKIPFVLYGSEYWNPLNEYIKSVLLEKFHTINPDDLNLYVITDDEDQILEILKQSKERRGEDSLK